MIKIPQRIIDEMISHAKTDSPVECCGLLAGRDGEVTHLYRLTNIDQSEVSYLIDPKEQIVAFKDMREKGVNLLAIYHSHTSTRAYPSMTDLRLAYYPDEYYIIISLQDMENIDIRAFKLNEGIITEGEIIPCQDLV